jgi:hypothetical protein
MAVLSDQFQEHNNESALDDWYYGKIGRVKANRISQELMDDAKMKATSMKFEQTRLLLESYHRCKSKGSKINFCHSSAHKYLFSLLCFELKVIFVAACMPLLY